MRCLSGVFIVICFIRYSGRKSLYRELGGNKTPNEPFQQIELFLADTILKDSLLTFLPFLKIILLAFFFIFLAYFFLTKQDELSFEPHQIVLRDYS